MTEKIKIIVVDDSAFMRKSLSIILASDPGIEVIATAKDGLEGVELVKKLKPDLVTLDIEMPRMDGLTALKKIMKDNPVPVIMVSSLTTEGADSTLKALELGAVDFIPKEMSFVSVNIVNIKEDLIKKVKAIVKQRIFRTRLSNLTGNRREQSFRKETGGTLPRMLYKSIAIGISTGGPLSLQKLVPKLIHNINCPVFIVQHMPPKFTKSLADRLNSMSSLTVVEAEDNSEVKKNTVYIAPGGSHMKVMKNGFGAPKIKITDLPSDTLHRPSVDVTLDSIVDVYGKQTLGVIMTGMGKDGLEGIKKLKALGGRAIAQDEQSCVVYGMPKAIVDNNLADVILPLEKISESINKVF